MAPPVDASPAADVVVDAGPPPPIVRISVDSDRSGTVDANDWQYRAELSATRGAMVLANLDDDNDDDAPDAISDEIDGDADAADLARVQLAAWPAAPTGAVGHLTVDEASAAKVRLFRATPDGWQPFNPAESTLDEAALRQGVEFGVEARDLAGQGWNGQITLTFAVTGADSAELGRDEARMRVAPWMIQNPFWDAIRVYVTEARGIPAFTVWVNDIAASTTADNVELIQMNSLLRQFRRTNEGPDPWIEDFMEFGWSSVPGPDGPHVMHYVMRSPNPQRPATTFALSDVMAPEMGYVWRTSTNAANGRYHDTSLDSTGNLEVTPPYRNGEHNYPQGRTYFGWTERRHGDVALLDFLESQGPQGPVIRVDTSWLLVGHVDELISWLPVAGSRLGYKMIIGAPALSRQILQGLVDRDPANADQILFRGQYFYAQNEDGTQRRYAAQRTIGAVLADADLMAVNDRVQAQITMIRAQFTEEMGLQDTDIIEVPFLFMAAENGRSVAMQPGSVNLLHYGHTVVSARPHSFSLNGSGDFFENDFVERLRPTGMTVRFAEEWDLLHAADGEVHCGTNVDRVIETPRWWEVTP